MAISVLPALALILGVALLASPKTAKAATNGGGGNGGGPGPGPGPGPGGTDPVGPGPGGVQPPPHNNPVPALFTVRQDDIMSKLALYYTKDHLRFKEMQHVSGPPINKSTGAWFPGTVVSLPASWLPFSKPMPIPNTQVPTSPPEFPEPF